MIMTSFILIIAVIDGFFWLCFLLFFHLTVVDEKRASVFEWDARLLQYWGSSQTCEKIPVILQNTAVLLGNTFGSLCVTLCTNLLLSSWSKEEERENTVATTFPFPAQRLCRLWRRTLYTTMSECKVSLHPDQERSIHLIPLPSKWTCWPAAFQISTLVVQIPLQLFHPNFFTSIRSASSVVHCVCELRCDLFWTSFSFLTSDIYVLCFGFFFLLSESMCTVNVTRSLCYISYEEANVGGWRPSFSSQALQRVTVMGGVRGDSCAE